MASHSSDPSVFSGTSQKRRACDDGRGRITTRHRSTRACNCCRNRKVRCDVSCDGVPCTNCRLNGVDCIVTESNRARKEASPTHHIREITADESPLRQLTKGKGAKRYRVKFDKSEALLNELAGQRRHNPPAASSDCIYVEAQAQPSDRTQLHPSKRRAETTRHSPHNVTKKPQSCLPPYIRRLPAHITSQDMEYLANKGALTIPDDELRNELLRTYITIIFPFLPAMDFMAFLESILLGDGDNPVSLLLFQAVMFASVNLVDFKFLKARGFSSRKKARETFFDRVRLLYGLDCEPDHLTLIESLLLMTYWHDCPPDDERDAWYWMGIVLTLAQAMNLHRDPEALDIPARDKHVRRRVWWACLIQDRLLALGIRRPIRIHDGEYDVAMLTLNDFEIYAPSQPLVDLVRDPRITGANAERRIAMCTMCIELTKLCICVGHIIYSQYTTLGSHANSSFEYLPQPIMLPKKSGNQILELAQCEAELNTWCQNQDPRSIYVSVPQGERAPQMTLLCQALLRISYLNAVAVLHRPHAFSLSGSVTASSKVSRAKVAESAISVTKLAFHLQSSSQLQYLATNSIPAFLSAALIHLLDVRSPNEEVRNMSIGRFFQCMQALHELEDIYPSAFSAIHFVDSVITSSGVDIPTFSSNFSLSKAGQVTHELSVAMGHKQIAEAYPSPLSLSQQHLDAPEEGQTSAEPDLRHTFSPLLSTFDLWPLDQGTLSIDQPREDLVSSWEDVDNIPALLDFDIDPALLGGTGDDRNAMFDERFGF
ncbi:putative c6 transcription factor protein [Ilyonectria robusta]